MTYSMPQSHLTSSARPKISTLKGDLHGFVQRYFPQTRVWRRSSKKLTRVSVTAIVDLEFWRLLVGKSRPLNLWLFVTDDTRPLRRKFFCNKLQNTQEAHAASNRSRDFTPGYTHETENTCRAITHGVHQPHIFRALTIRDVRGL